MIIKSDKSENFLIFMKKHVLFQFFLRNSNDIGCWNENDKFVFLKTCFVKPMQKFRKFRFYSKIQLINNLIKLNNYYPAFFFFAISFIISAPFKQ